MAHYVFLDENNLVTEVITGRDEDDLENLPEGFASWEEFYLNERPYATDCKRTSYNTYKNEHLFDGVAFRGNYAGGVGFQYDPDNDVFYELQPYPSWTLDEQTWSWIPPIPQPNDTVNVYQWDEEGYQADTNDPKTVGWKLAGT